MINSNRFRYPKPVIPIGLCSVAASIERAGYEVFVLDLCFSKNCVADISNTISTLHPDIIGVSIRNIDNIGGSSTRFLLDDINNNIIVNIKKCFRGEVVIGGSAVGISGVEILELFNLEYAICGDGEIAMVEFIRRIDKKMDMLKELRGLIIRKDREIVWNPASLLVEDLDALPFPRPHRYLNLKPYRQFDSAMQIQTKRGCALKCVYCTYSRIEGNCYRYRQPELVANEIEMIVEETGINHIEFIDSVFNIPLEHAKSVLRALRKKKMNLRLRAVGLNPGAIDEELVDLMHQVGFRDVGLGAEAGCDAILSALGKSYRIDDLLRAGKLLHERNMSILWCLLVGALEETQETVWETLGTLIRIASPWDIIDISIGVRIYKGSLLAENMMGDEKYCSGDNFLHSVYIAPRRIDLYRIKAIVKQAAFHYSNIFVYDERKRIPFIVLRIYFLLLKVFASHQPMWKIYILIRRIEKLVGIRFVKIWLMNLMMENTGNPRDVGNIVKFT